MFLRFVFAFFQFVSTISRQLHKIFSLNAYISEPRWVSVPFPHRPGSITNTEFFPEKLDEIFRPTWSFAQKQYENWFLPTAFLKCDKFLPVTLWPNDIVSKKGSRPNVYLTMLYVFWRGKLFSCQKTKLAKTRETDFPKGKWNFILTFWAHAHRIVN